MYETLVKKLRELPHLLFVQLGGYENLVYQAADAIESTSKAYQMMAEAYESEVTKHGWIPVTERLPENGEYVLCFCRANIVCVLRRDKDGDWYENPTHVYMSNFITHWIPLPEPPKEE